MKGDPYTSYLGELGIYDLGEFGIFEVTKLGHQLRNGYINVRILAANWIKQSIKF